ncbi:hypothetical protein H9W91_07100 [Streptomyces alfalfae]|uniref:hypothetical protein n=1 Tax=Streptomyces alfalfae TaxID=1642299 RepID=UPI001BAA40FB|nr:hypothetical protein [Streptomyces alfalfae]QUI30655.1 hypothetical protein H9W91_07100 [Streptomyces alfalfae]
MFNDDDFTDAMTEIAFDVARAALRDGVKVTTLFIEAAAEIREAAREAGFNRETANSMGEEFFISLLHSPQK